MKVKNLSNVIKKYKFGWISISKDNKEVVAWGRSFSDLHKKLENLNNPEGFIMKISKDFSNYVGSEKSA